MGMKMANKLGAAGTALALAFGMQGVNAENAHMNNLPSVESVERVIDGPGNRQVEDCLETRMDESLSMLFATGGYRKADFAPAVKKDPLLRVNNYRHIAIPSDEQFRQNLSDAFHARSAECFAKSQVREDLFLVKLNPGETDYYVLYNDSKGRHLASKSINFGSDHLGEVRKAVDMINESDGRWLGDISSISYRIAKSPLIASLNFTTVESARGNTVDSYRIYFSDKDWKIPRYSKSSGVPKNIVFRLAELVPDSRAENLNVPGRGRLRVTKKIERLRKKYPLAEMRQVGGVPTEFDRPRMKHLVKCMLKKVDESVSEVFATGGYRIGDYPSRVKGHPYLRVNEFRHVTVPTDSEFDRNLNDVFARRSSECFSRYDVSDAATDVRFNPKKTEFFARFNGEEYTYTRDISFNFGSDMLHAVRKGVDIINRRKGAGIGYLLMLTYQIESGLIPRFSFHDAKTTPGYNIHSLEFRFSYREWVIPHYRKSSGVPRELVFTLAERVLKSK
jgi:hypothetical protein